MLTERADQREVRATCKCRQTELRLLNVPPVLT